MIQSVNQSILLLENKKGEARRIYEHGFFFRSFTQTIYPHFPNGSFAGETPRFPNRGISRANRLAICRHANAENGDFATIFT
jgi:hypothetical protein